MNLSVKSESHEITSAQNTITDFTETPEEDDDEKESNITLKSFPIAIVVVIIYMCFGIFWDLWHPGWMIFLFISVFHWLISTLKDGGKPLSIWLAIPYPVVATAIFFLLSFLPIQQNS